MDGNKGHNYCGTEEDAVIRLLQLSCFNKLWKPKFSLTLNFAYMLSSSWTFSSLNLCKTKLVVKKNTQIFVARHLDKCWWCDC